ncbi:MAG: glycosyltransferase family 39 protein [Isosphaeraceae bacterium]
MTPHPPILRQNHETLVVVLLTILAAAVRLYGLGRIGLTHFDEGVYAFAGLWSVGAAGLGPDLIPYAPPGFPILVGLSYAVLGVADISAVLASIACGVATVPVAAWVARRTFGPGAGGAAAAFTCLSIAHIAFSRKALTDVPFLLFWMLAIGLGARFLERPGLWRGVVLGLAVGLAQNFKYSGWVAGLIVIASAVVSLGVDRNSRSRVALLRTFGFGAVGIVVAGAVYLPWFLYVENHGGYAALLRHHQSYMRGISSWPGHWSQQLAQVTALSGWRAWGLVTWTAAWLAAGFGACGRRWVLGRSRNDWTRFRVGGLLGASFLAGIPDLAWWGGLAWFLWLVTDPRPSVRLLACWWLILSVMTPFYTPYARLWLPLHGAGWILMAGAVVALGPFSEAGVVESTRGEVLFTPKVLTQCAVVLFCLVFARAHWSWYGAEPGAFRVAAFFRPTDSLRSAVAACVTSPTVANQPGMTLDVLARRPVAFYLAQAGRVPFRLVAGPEDLKGGVSGLDEWGLADEALLSVTAEWNPAPVPGRHRLRPAERWDTLLDPVTLLDVRPGVVREVEIPPVHASLVLMKPTPGPTSR